MNLGARITREAMVASFLRAEFQSARYQRDVRAALYRAGSAVSVETMITDPDLSNAEHNRLRERVLMKVGSHGGKINIFDGFPAEVAWHEAVLDPQEVERLYYVRIPLWTQFARGTGRVLDGAHRAKYEFQSIGNIPNTMFWKVAGIYAVGASFPPPIVVATSLERAARRVLLDGHLRVTALLFNPIVPPLRILLGVSPDFAAWPLY